MMTVAGTWDQMSYLCQKILAFIVLSAELGSLTSNIYIFKYKKRTNNILRNKLYCDFWVNISAPFMYKCKYLQNDPL